MLRVVAKDSIDQRLRHVKAACMIGLHSLVVPG
jgi:hypothetical protein